MRSLFSIAGFGSYVVIIFLNAMTDLGHKIVLQNTIFKAYEGSELIVLTAIVNALILLPFIFLFSPAGFISDKYPKTRVMEYAALAAVGITVLILLSYMAGWFWVAFAFTFLLAAQSAIYSPAKYGIIKEMAGSEKLAEANGVVQAVTIVSILLGAVIYSVFFEILLKERSTDPSLILQYIAPLGFALIGASLVEYLLARKLVREFPAVAEAPKLVFDPQRHLHYKAIKRMIRLLRSNELIWLSIIGLSLFWGISQVVVAIFGDYLKGTLGITNTVVAQGLLSLSGVGIVAGSLFAARMSRNFIETGIIPLGAAGITIVLFAIPSLHALWSLGIAIFLFGFSAGLLIVPLNALMQFATPMHKLGKVLAGNNLIQNISMLLFLVLTALTGIFSLSSTVLFYLVACVALAGMGYTILKLPQSLIRYIVRILVAFRYRLDVQGLEHVDLSKGVLLLGNHVSFLDWAILQMAYPGQIRFVMERSYYEVWYLKPFFAFFDAIPISSRGSKRALEEVTKALKQGDSVAIFPEGHLSRNGQIGTFQKGYQLATRGVENAVVIPFYIRGLWEDRFSHASAKVARNRTRMISVTFGKPMPIRTKAAEAREAVLRLSVQAWQSYARQLPSLQEAWLSSAKANGSRLMVTDSSGSSLSGRDMILRVWRTASFLRPKLGPSQRVGIVLPASVEGAVVTMALLSMGRTVVPLNDRAGAVSLQQMIVEAGVDTVVTDRSFMEKMRRRGWGEDTFGTCKFCTLDGIREWVGWQKLTGAAVIMLLPKAVLRLWLSGARSEAVVVFSSKGKGVRLSHRNLMGNIKQIATILNPTDEDVMLGALPLYHALGLTTTLLLPLVEGIPLVCHDDPKDGDTIGKLAARHKATLLFSTPVLLHRYAGDKRIHPLMFETLRLVVSGGGRVPMRTYDGFKTYFDKEIYEGYGVTETTPVATVNLKDVLLEESWQVQKGHKRGSVGLPLPGTLVMIVDPIHFTPLKVGEEGLVLIGGPQVMQGYLHHEGEVSTIHEIDGIRWFVTGDRGMLDSEGFLTILS
jgi:acyl-[acyl-carrier-protein]-phospholipid O-acyltransferase/long-chain-fatty-acid--[acyl-carrier-protein] ligase